jgi:hypothetical protein
LGDTAQAIVGSLTVLLTFYLGRLILRPVWAALSALFTALSPHLVAMDHFILSEPLFTFFIMLSLLVMAMSWQKKSLALSFFSGMFFGFSTLIRPVALLLGTCMSVLYLINPEKYALRWKRSAIQQILLLHLGYALIYAPFLILRNTGSPGTMSVSDQSLRKKVIIGMDINLKNFIRFKTDPERIRELNQMIHDDPYAWARCKERFRAKPLSHLAWYLGGKTLFMWRWDNIYRGGPGGIGDVYQYPMIKRGFHDNRALHALHSLMRQIHWPLFVLTLASPFFFLIRRGHPSQPPKGFRILVPLLAFLYFAILLTLLVPLPRYAIPLRPLSYIMAVFSIHHMFQKRFHHGPKADDQGSMKILD